MLSKIENYDDFQKNVIFFDETIFHVNRTELEYHSVVYRATKGTHIEMY